jgi:glutaminase
MTIEPSPWVSTGVLPPPDEIERVIGQIHQRHRSIGAGKVADYIPALGRVSPELFGIAVVGVTGRAYSAGDAGVEFTIQSVSKPFVFAVVCDRLGAREAKEKLGVNATGLPFDSVFAIELNQARTANPLVNAGALAATSLVPGAGIEEKWETLRHGFSRFAGRELVLDEEVFESEMSSNRRNRGIAHLLAGYGRMYADPDEATELYTRQCSLRVTARDLAVMGATLADGGVNPVSGGAVVSEEACERTVAVMATAGLYELSGEWLYDIGLPAKSGVSGGIVTVSPGKGGCGTFSPPLDAAGNSVRGQLAVRDLSYGLGLNVFASRSEPAEG